MLDFLGLVNCAIEKHDVIHISTDECHTKNIL